MNKKKSNQIVLIAGLSGAGKSTALHTFADFGYRAIDGLPLPLIADFIKLADTPKSKYSKTALLLGVETDQVQEIIQLLTNLKTRPDVEIIFLDAANKQLICRYSETRRPHPYFCPMTDSNLEDAIEKERQVLNPLKEAAHLVINTSDLNVHDLRRKLIEHINLKTNDNSQLRVNFITFGFKYGLPSDCDLVVDVRFLPNPHFIPELKPKNGLDQEVRDYVLLSSDASEFIKKYSDLIAYLLPKYSKEGKSYLTIGVGCTGGKHRSVAIAENLAQFINKAQYKVSVSHRDLQN